MLNNNTGGSTSYECHEVLCRVFGHSEFKGKQEEVVQAAIAGQDVFVLAPTGMGKSLCFQLPAVMAKNGVTLVISPLCSLMNNQVDNLRKKGVNVVSWTSNTGFEERKEIEKDLLSDHPGIRLLYVSPEKYATSECTRLLDGVHRKRNLNQLVIDEAHCISEWGHNFRSDYRRLGKFRDRYNDIPIMALTATATPVVQRDIIHSLKMDRANLFHVVHPFNRANLFYEVRYLSSLEPHMRMQGVFEYITMLYQRRNRASSGIIYCRAKATCNELSAFLRIKGLNAKPYHRGISPEVLEETLRDWSMGGNGVQGGTDLVVATIAFGLGIDKGDVRYIIHYDLPTSFEGYYQETGRAGRDGQPSKCILYYSREDAKRVQDLVATSNPNRPKDDFKGPSPTQRAVSSLDELIQYAENIVTCRHISVCRYFGETIDSNDPQASKSYCQAMCDVCKYPEKTKIRIRSLTPVGEMQIFSRDSQPQCRGAPRVAAPQPRKNGVGNTSEENKRGYTDPEFTGPSKSSKRSKTRHTPYLNTIPFESAKQLSRPFKPPSIKRQEEHAQAQCDPYGNDGSDRAEDQRELNHPHVGNKAPKLPAPEIQAEPLGQVQIPDVEVELENLSSEKFSLPTRMDGFNKIRRALHSINLNSIPNSLHFPDLASSRRGQTFLNSAREAEFMAFSLSSTTEGYRARIDRVVRGVLCLPQLNPDKKYDEDRAEDVQDILDILQRHCDDSKQR